MRAPSRLKRTLAAVATGALALSLLPGVAFADTVEFDDVCENAPDANFPDIGSTHAAAINCMSAYEVIEGRDDGTYGTQVDIQRQQYATLLARFALTANPALAIDTSDAGFTDLVSATHSPNVNALANLEIVFGTTDTTFSPNASLTRAQAASTLVRAHEALGVVFNENATSDFEDLGETHGDNINKLVDAGIIEGYTATEFGYSDPVTRGQIATFLARSAQVLANQTPSLWDADPLPAPVPGVGEDRVTLTSAPELVRVNRTAAEGVVEYIFDSPITGQALQTVDLIAANLATDEATCEAAGARNFDVDTNTCFLYQDILLYDAAGNAAWPYEASIFDDRIRVRYAGSATAFGITGDVADDNNIVEGAVRATVRSNTVENVERTPNPASHFGLTVIDESSASVTPFAPELVSVGNYRLSPISIGGETRVLVDFTFADEIGAAGVTEFGDDEVAAAAGPPVVDQVDAGEFYVVGNASAEFQGLTFFTDGNIAPPTATDTVVTVAMAADPTDIPQINLRRGFVVHGDTAAVADPAGVAGDPGVVGTDGGTSNVVQSQPFTLDNGTTTDGLTTDPDLVSVERVSLNRFKFVFDEAISDVPAEYDAGNFSLYNGDRGAAGAEPEVIDGVDAFPSAIPADDASAIFVDFDADDVYALDEITNAYIGGFVADGAVTATDNVGTENNGQNRPASALLELPGDESGSTPLNEFTARPDLEEIRVARNSVTQNYQVAFEFDESVAGVVDDIEFALYDEAGTRFAITGATGRSLQQSDEVVVFSVDAGFSELSNEQIESAVTGSVEIDDLVGVFIPDNLGGTAGALITEGQQNL